MEIAMIEIAEVKTRIAILREQLIEQAGNEGYQAGAVIMLAIRIDELERLLRSTDCRQAIGDEEERIALLTDVYEAACVFRRLATDTQLDYDRWVNGASLKAAAMDLDEQLAKWECHEVRSPCA